VKVRVDHRHLFVQCLDSDAEMRWEIQKKKPSAPDRKLRRNTETPKPESHGSRSPRHPAYFINREASWLEFNRRVLQEAEDESNPVLERVKFLAISA